MEEHWLYLSIRGLARPSEEALIKSWRQASADNERRYQELAATLELIDAAGSRLSHEPRTNPPAPLKLIHIAETRRATSAAGKVDDAVHARRRAVFRWFPALGAAAAAVVVAFYAVLGQLRIDSASAIKFEADEFVTGASETATVTLRDGTVVRLAPESRLRLSDAMHVRAVSLTGRAYFAVARDVARPFVIETNAGRVEVTGTRFDIQAAENNLRVLVVEGQVALAGRGGKSEVNAGEMRQMIAGTALPSVPVDDVASAISWVGNFLAFQETPLADAAREIAQLYGVDIEIVGSSLANQTITTWFADESLEQVMTVFCMVAEAECTTTPGEPTRILVQPRRSW